MAIVNWQLDPTHSNIGFVVRHMMITNVRGSFNSFEANVTADPDDLSTAQITVTIDPNSIDTRNEQRDEHLRSADFFNTEQHPSIEFKSTRLQHEGGEEYTLEGSLTIMGITKPVTLKCEIVGPAKDPWGNEKIGVTATGSLNRKDFGLNWNAVLEAGGVLVGETVKLEIEMEFVKS